jgi:beta-phosphoglucomutase-like phosphatase (HAD superfamily)
MDIVFAQCKPRFHHEYALSRLVQDGYKLAVASNSIRNTVHVMLERSALLGYLDFYMSNQDVKLGKPDPEIYTKVIQKLGLSPQECLVVEDNEKGIQAAIASGAWLMEVDKVEDVNYQNIIKNIMKIEGFSV